MYSFQTASKNPPFKQLLPLFFSSVQGNVMSHGRHKEFGALITRLIHKKDLSGDEARSAFSTILNNETSDLQQGAFLAALSAKGETRDEVAGAWRAIYELDTVKVAGLEDLSPVENCGTGMDTFKTFNISSAAALVAAEAGVHMARHGARALSSVCGTVDIAEALGVDVECSAELAAKSIRYANIGLFNGMSPNIHPMALGRILSQIHFGSTLNISASLANPARPALAVRGVFSPEAIDPVAAVMKETGFQKAFVLFGRIDGSDKGMDEASVCGKTEYAEFGETGKIQRGSFRPEDFGLALHKPESLAPQMDIQAAAIDFVRIISGLGNPARSESVVLNAALVLYISGNAASIAEGVKKSAAILYGGDAMQSLMKWVQYQNRNPEAGLEKLKALISRI